MGHKGPPYAKFRKNKTLSNISEFTVEPVLCPDSGPYVIGSH